MKSHKKLSTWVKHQQWYVRQFLETGDTLSMTTTRYLKLEEIGFLVGIDLGPSQESAGNAATSDTDTTQPDDDDDAKPKALDPFDPHNW